MNTPLVLHLMRHGAPEVPGRMLGHVDAPVSTRGIADCTVQGARLHFGALVASDLGRATVCAEAIAAVHGVPLVRDARWRELDFGAWDGLAPTEIDADALSAFWTDPDACPPPRGERWADLRARVAGAIATITEPTLVVAHAGSIRAALSVLCGLDYRQSWTIDLPYAAVVSLRLWRAPTPNAQITGLMPCGG